MVTSMTGYSKAEANEKNISISIEIKTYNSKGLDLNVRLPKSLSQKELTIREEIRKKISRGSVNVYISSEVKDSASEFNIITEKAQDIHAKLSELRKQLKIRDSIKIEHLLKYSDYFVSKESEIDSSTEWKLLSKSLSSALNSLIEMRNEEGKNIQKDISQRIKKVHDLVKQIEVEGVERIPSEREKLKQKVAQLFDSDDIDENRIQFEMVMMADKLDISEECVRLNSHLKLFHDTMRARISNGRKLNFILQEMNREINTIGAKCNDASMSHKVVAVKEEIEKIREQVQNVE